jgi:hypothetical protein
MSTTKKQPTKKPATKKSLAKSPPNKPTSKAPETKPTKNDGADMLSVSDVAREMGVDPKAARAALRAAGKGADGTRYSKIARGSAEHTELMLFLEGNQDGVDSSRNSTR